MEIQIIRNESELLREYRFSSRPVEANTGVFNKKREESGHRREIARDTAYDNKPALLPKGSVRSDAHQTVVPIQSSLTKKENDIIFLNKKIDLDEPLNSENTIFYLNISTETVKDQYAIKKVTLDASDQKTGKYKKAQAYRLLLEPTLEIYA